MAALLLWAFAPPAAALAQPRETPRTQTAAAPGLPPNVERVDSLGGITQYRLRSNGMTILLSPNHAAPVITFLVVYHVGSRNEAPGNTGSAHLLEHMLFNKSTKNFGHANGHKTFQEVLYEAGADFSSTNMTTWYDRMTGYSTLPADKLDLAIRIEADRMGRALILDAERQPEMSVVRNEYEIGENNPSNALEKAVIATCIVAHPYHWDTIGYRSDIEGVSTETLRDHYRNFFWPDNAEAVLVGDFDPMDALRMFDQEFGAFPRSKSPIPTVITVEPPQEGERRVVVNRPGQVGLVELAYLRPGALDPDFIPLDVLATILSTGINSRLYQAVVETGLATDVDASNYTLRDPYPILVSATVSPGSTHEKVEAALKAALYAVGEKGVTEAELVRAKSRIEVSVIRDRDGTYPLASSMGEAVASANWKWFVNYLDVMNRVTAADVQHVAKSYLIPSHANVGWYVPIRNDAPPAKAPATPKKSAARPKRPGAGGASEPDPARGGSFADRTLHRVLPNGMTLDVVENHAVPTVAVYGLALAGRQESAPGKPAIPTLTAMMLTRGTITRDKRVIAALLDSVGATLNISAELSEAPIVGGALSKDTRLLLSVIADELQNPAFKPDELAKAKSEMEADLSLSYESTGLRARERLLRLAYPKGHPFCAADREEMLASLKSATTADLRAFHADRYVGAGIILSVVGDVDTTQVAAWVSSLFGGIPKGARPRYDLARTEPNPPQRVIETMRGKANMDFIIGEASGLRRTDPEWEAAIVANAALGQSSLTSRIGKRVRDKEGLSYSLYSRYLCDLIDGVWMVDVAVAPKNLAKAIHSTREEIDRYAKEGITAEEVETQKNFFAGNYKVRLGNNAGVASSLTFAEKFGYGPRYLDEFPERVRAVTREQVNAVIKARLLPEKLHLVVAGDLDSIPE